MRIRAKAVIILAVSVGVMGTSLVAISLTVLRSGFIALEERHALLDLARVRRACTERLESLGRTARDWARWDDTWEFITGSNPGFVAANLDDESLAALDADLMLFVARDGRLVHAQVRRREGLVVPAGAVDAILRFGGLKLPAPQGNRSVSGTGVLPFPGAPLFFAVHPVYHSNGTGPAAGWFLIGRFLDADRLGELAANVGLELRFAPTNSLAPGVAAVVHPLDSTRLLVRGSVADPEGTVAFVVEIREPREISRRGMATIRTFLYLAIGVGTLVGAVSLLLLHRGVIARIESLDTQVRRISGAARGAPAVAIEGADEISHLARSINEMLHSLATADETLLRSERLAAVGTLAGGVAHQFNNLHTGLLAYADLALSRPGLDEVVRGYLEQIVKGVQRAGMITRGLLAFSGDGQQALTPCRLDEVVADALPLVSRELARYEITLETRLDEVPAIPMDPALIQQVALNILLNAVHAVIGRPERRIEVETGASGPYVRLEVHDTGCGIRAEDRGRLFTPFFSTKGEHARKGSAQEQVTGTGLGLSVSHSIVARHGGRIEVESAEGVGSTFTVLLPREAPGSLRTTPTP